MSAQTAPVPDTEEAYEYAGAVPVDSGMLLIVDPCALPPDVVAAITTPNAYGVVRARAISVGDDGLYPVDLVDGDIIIGGIGQASDATDEPYFRKAVADWQQQRAAGVS